MLESSARKTPPTVNTCETMMRHKGKMLMCGNLVEVGGDGHLLVQLRRLSEEGGTLEVVHLEHVGSSLGGGADDLRRVDLDEAGLGQRVAEESAHSGLESEDGLVGRGAQVQHAVVQPGVLVHLGEISLKQNRGFLILSETIRCSDKTISPLRSCPPHRR